MTVMRKVLKITLIFIFIINLIILISSTFTCEEIKSNKLYVGGNGNGNYTSIQDAINESENGTIIHVYNGIYYENLLINKSIILIGEDKYNTIIDGNGIGTIITIISNNVSINGFTIQNSSHNNTDCFVSGIKIYSNYNIISDNIITNNQIGISISGDACYPYFLSNFSNSISIKNKIFDNLITKNSIIGVGIYRSSNSMIYRNNITSNKLGFINFNSNNNSFYLNNFQNNTENVNDLGKNFWFSKNIGNYYEDYIGLDKNNDGIGDTPYEIPGGDNIDEFPLMMPYDGTIQLKEFYVDYDSVFNMLIIGIIISIIFVLPIAYYWRKKYFL
jgi:nitrous oxidase accessory protein NosD